MSTTVAMVRRVLRVIALVVVVKCPHLTAHARLFRGCPHCVGNAWYEGDALLVAMRDIKAGEEIFYDYALTENHPDFAFPQCLCKSKNCRGRISGNDWQLPELQDKYGRHFLPHVLKSIWDSKKAVADQEKAGVFTKPQ